jgi:DNA-binding NtrC family response regulator
VYDSVADIDAGPGVGLGLHAVGKRAALDAERRAIFEALERFQWNRRKTSTYLSVSYKTLLNKIKECGITVSAAP